MGIYNLSCNFHYYIPMTSFILLADYQRFSSNRKRFILSDPVECLPSFQLQAEKRSSSLHMFCLQCHPYVIDSLQTRQQIPIATSATHIYNKGQIIIYAATTPNEQHQCILTHFNNRNFRKTQIVCSLRMVFFTPKHVGAF